MFWQSFCSSDCYAKSTHFKQQLLISPLWMRDDKNGETAVTFHILEDNVQLHGVIVNVTGLKLTDEDKEKDSESRSSEDDNKADNDKHS